MLSHKINALAVHVYGTSAQDFIDYVTDFHQTFGYNIWVTEFACQDFSGGAPCSYDEAFTFMREVTSWMDKTSFVDTYFAYGT